MEGGNPVEDRVGTCCLGRAPFPPPQVSLSSSSSAFFAPASSCAHSSPLHLLLAAADTVTQPGQAIGDDESPIVQPLLCQISQD